MRLGDIFRGFGVQSDHGVNKSSEKGKSEKARNAAMKAPIDTPKAKSKEMISKGNQVEQKAHNSKISLGFVKGGMFGKVLGLNKKSESSKAPSLKDQLYEMNDLQIDNKKKEITERKAEITKTLEGGNLKSKEIKALSDEFVQLDEDKELCDLFSLLQPNYVFGIGIGDKILQGQLDGKTPEQMGYSLKLASDVLDKVKEGMKKHNIDDAKLSKKTTHGIEVLEVLVKKAADTKKTADTIDWETYEPAAKETADTLKGPEPDIKALEKDVSFDEEVDIDNLTKADIKMLEDALEGLEDEKIDFDHLTKADIKVLEDALEGIDSGAKPVPPDLTKEDIKMLQGKLKDVDKPKPEPDIDTFIKDLKNDANFE